jgi:lactate dehydrogenase-like 2-hydroxyacid dehydrogenase
MSIDPQRRHVGLVGYGEVGRVEADRILAHF